MLAARCQRFYQSGEPTVWLRMPLLHLAFFVAEIAGLQAEESLRRVQELRVAFAPPGEEGDGLRLVERAWRTRARRDERIREPPPQRKISRSEYDAMLAMAGIVRREWVVDE